MTVKTHKLKIKPEFMIDILSGNKTFEVRKFDRDYKIDDIIMFVIQFDNPVFYYKQWRITYILDHDDFPEGIKKGYCVLGIKEV